MTLIACIAVTGDVRGPLVIGCIGVTSANVLVLQRFELLLGTQFIGLERLSVYSVHAYEESGRYHFDLLSLTLLVIRSRRWRCARYVLCLCELSLGWRHSLRRRAE